MINEQENRVSLTKQSDLEYEKNSVEMMRYRTNGLSYKLGILGMAFSVLGAFMCLNSANPNNVFTLLIVLLNIVILLGGFLAAEKVKNYIKGGAVAQIVFGSMCIARMFWVPLLIIINYHTYKGYMNGTIPFDTEKYDTYDAVPAYKAAEKYLGLSIRAVDINDKQAYAYFPANGYARGAVAMIFFAIAGAFFIIAGVIGYKRASKLHKYLTSINVKK